MFEIDLEQGIDDISTFILVNATVHFDRLHFSFWFG